MGYESTINIEAKVREDKIKEFEEAIKKLCRTSDATFLTETEDIIKDYFTSGEIVFNPALRSLDISEQESHWYATKELASFLAPYMEKGVMELVGEDKEKWGFEFDGEGFVYKQKYALPTRGDAI